MAGGPPGRYCPNLHPQPVPLPLRFLTAALCLVSAFGGGCARRVQPDRASTFTHEVRLLPSLAEVSGVSWTLVSDRATAVGGTTISTGQPSRAVYVYDDAAGRWIAGSAELPAGSRLARVLATPAGSLLVEAAPGRAPLWLRPGMGGQPEIVALPALLMGCLGAGMGDTRVAANVPRRGRVVPETYSCPSPTLKGIDQVSAGNHGAPSDPSPAPGSIGRRLRSLVYIIEADGVPRPHRTRRPPLCRGAAARPPRACEGSCRRR